MVDMHITKCIAPFLHQPHPHQSTPLSRVNITLLHQRSSFRPRTTFLALGSVSKSTAQINFQPTPHFPSCLPPPLCSPTKPPHDHLSFYIYTPFSALSSPQEIHN
ncbi:hypothetical protein ACOSQ3_030200 [Xanthoceras sorbifolium]